MAGKLKSNVVTVCYYCTLRLRERLFLNTLNLTSTMLLKTSICLTYIVRTIRLIDLEDAYQCTCANIFVYEYIFLSIVIA